MADESRALSKAQINVGSRGLHIATFDDLQRWANALHASELAPKSLNTPAKIIVAVQTGLEAGLTPMQAVRSVVVINGLPSWKGETALGLIRRAGVSVDVGTRGEGDKREGYMTFQIEQGGPLREVVFSVADAKRATLWGKAGPWTTNPDDMLMWRAVGRGSRRYFSHLLLGIYTEHEVRDIPPEERLAGVVERLPDPLLALDAPEARTVQLVGKSSQRDPIASQAVDSGEDELRWLDPKPDSAMRRPPEDRRTAEDGEIDFARLEWVERVRDLAGEDFDEAKAAGLDIDGLRAWADELER